MVKLIIYYQQYRISICASLVNVYGQGKEKRVTRFGLFIAFIVAYFTFTIVFGERLNGWNESLPGHCYNTKLVAFPSHSHPYVDLIYVGITCFWCLVALLGCFSCHGLLSSSDNSAKLPPFIVTALQKRRVLESSFFDIAITIGWQNSMVRQKAEELAPGIVILAMLQYPLHLYMVIAMRAANEARLSGDSENTWGFGQIVALISAFSTVLECVRARSSESA
jgi:hypothetical protein